MWDRVVSLIRKELLAVLRDPRSRMTLIGPPILQLVIFSFAATLDVQNASVGVLNRDAGRWSAELQQRIAAAPSFSEIRRVNSIVEMERLVDNQEVIATVHIPLTFSRDIAANQPTDVQIVLDGRRSNASQIVNGYLSDIIGSLGAYPPATETPTAEIVERSWFNPNLNYMWFTVPSLIGIIAVVGSLTVTALSIARERELGTYDQLMVSPMRPHEIIIGKTIPPLIIALAQTTVFILAAIFIFQIPFRGSMLLLYYALVIFLISIVGIGLFISSLSQTQQQAFLGSFLFISPAILLSGFAAPVENMPQWLQIGNEINPLAHFLVIVKGVFLKGLPPDEIFLMSLPLIAIAAATLTAATYMFNARME